MTAKSPSGVDFVHVKRVVPLTAILSRYGLDGEFRRVGASLRGACPIHKGSNKRQFVIDPNASTWRCFGDCNRGGASLEFVAEMERVGIREAAVLIAQWFAIAMPRRIEQPQLRRKTVSGGKPSHKAYVVEDRGEGDDKDAFWTRIGSAWPHGDGKGLNIQIASGVAVSGRLVLREYTDEDAAEDEKKTAANKGKRK